MIGLLVILAHVADLLTFLCAMSVLPLTAELNPIARWVYAEYGVLGAVSLKVAGATGIVAILYAYPDGSLRNVLIAAAVAIGLFGAVTNTLSVMVTR